MVDETNSQVNSATTVSVDDGYEYEYIELAEGEELPEGAEYEYEYVEVPVDEAGQEIFSEDENVVSQITDVATEGQNVLPQENTSQFVKSNADNVAEQVVYEPVGEPLVSQSEIVEEPHLEIETPSGEWKEDESLPKFEDLAEDNQVEDLKMPDFLTEPRSESARLDEILDDDSPLQNVNFQPEGEVADDEFEKELFGTPAPDLNLDDFEEVTPAPEPVVEPVMTEEVVPAPEPVAEPVMAEEVTPASEPVVEPVMTEEVVPAPEPVAEPVVAEEVMPAPEPMVQEQKVQEEPNEELLSVREEIVSIQSKDSLPQSLDYQVPPQEAVIKTDSVAKDEQVSVSGLVEENVPVITAPVAHAPVAEPTPAHVFQQTEEIPVEIKVYDMSDDEYQSLCSVAFPFNKNSGFRGFQADEKVYNLVIEDIDVNQHEENDWSLIIFDDYRVRLSPNEKELVLPKGDNTVRYAKIMKSGKTKLELFNEEKYTFMAPTEDFAKIRGHYIYGNIANNSKLIVKDFVNISLGDKLGKQITFNKPVSGLLTGPKASKLYFSDVRSVIVPSAKQMHQNEEKERSKAARWYSGSSDDKCFEFDAKSQISEFVGNNECKIIHVNVGISHYGWNITFSNGLFMSFRDLLEYQTRYGQLPDNSGVITHGQQTLKFANVEKIIIYEAAQYFTYG